MVSKRTIAVLLAALCISLSLSGVVLAVENDQSRTAEGVTVYLGVVPAEIVKGLLASSTTKKPMHGSIPKGPHEYHVVAVDAASGARVSDAVVIAEVSGLGLSGAEKKLEPMQTSSTTTYGGFFDPPEFDLYTVKLTHLFAMALVWAGSLTLLGWELRQYHWARSEPLIHQKS